MREKFKHGDYWMGWIQIGIGGFLIGGITHGAYTPLVLILAIPSTIMGFYLTTFKTYKIKVKPDDIKRGN